MIKAVKQLGGKIVEDVFSETTWNLLSVDKDGSRNGWYEKDAAEKPKPPKEVVKMIEKRNATGGVETEDLILPQPTELGQADQATDQPTEEAPTNQPTNQVTEEMPDVENMKRNELMAWLKEKEIKFSPRAKNDELIKIIKDAIS